MSDILWLKGIQSGDRFVILCEKCEKEVRTKYLGWDPSVPHFKATCENCGTSTTLKLTSSHWEGLPPKPHI